MSCSELSAFPRLPGTLEFSPKAALPGLALGSPSALLVTPGSVPALEGNS